MLPSDRRPTRFCMHGSWRCRRANTVIQCGSHCPRRLLGMPATAQAGESILHAPVHLLGNSVGLDVPAKLSRAGARTCGLPSGIFDLAREQSHEVKGPARSKQRSGHFLTDTGVYPHRSQDRAAEELTVTRGQPHRNRARPADCGRSSEGFQPTRGEKGPLAQRCSGGQRLQKVSAMPTLMRVYQPLCNSFCAQ